MVGAATHTLSYALQMKLALVAFAAVLLLALLLVLRPRVTEVKPRWPNIHPIPMAIEPDWSEPAIDDESTTIVTEPVMQGPGWLSRNKYKVGLGGLSLLALGTAAKQSPWRSMPRPSFSNFAPGSRSESFYYAGY